jgi:predicted GIY-YIG superfamily endonuclease
MQHIYILIDPSNNNIFYVGKTNNVDYRYYHHLWEAKTNKDNSRKSQYIRMLLEKNLAPNVVVVCSCEDNEWAEKEIFFIDYYKNMGFELTNTAPGGGAYPNWSGKHHSDETKNKISSALIGIVRKKGKRGKQNNPQTTPRWDKGLIGRGGKKVNQYDLNGLFIASYNSTNEAALKTGSFQSSVVRCCNGKLKYTNGYVFKYPINDMIYPPE